MNVQGPASSWPARPAASAPPARPADAPAAGGPADPAAGAPAPAPATLWELLTPEERAFFAREQSLGPLSYSPGRPRAAADAPLGGRLDVRG